MSEKVLIEPLPAYPGPPVASAPGHYEGAPPPPDPNMYPAGTHNQPQQYPPPQYSPQQDPPPQYSPQQQYPQAPGAVVTEQPISATTTTQVIAVEPGDICPNCGIGYLSDKFSVMGIVCAILCFPWGLLCLLRCKDRECSRCGYSYMGPGRRNYSYM